MSRLEIDPGDRRNPVLPPPSAKRRARFGGVAKAVAAALAVAVLAWGVRYGSDYLTSPQAPPGPVPVIGPDAGPVKVVPENPGGVSVPDQDKVILNGGNAQPKVEQLLPPPETPLPSPAPPAPPQAVQTQQTAPPVASAAPPPPQPAAQPQPSPPQPQQTSTPPAVASAPPEAASAIPRPAVPAPAMVAPPPPKPAMTAANPPAPQTAALPPGKGYFLQLGALRSVELAQQSWTRLKTAQPDILGNLPANAVKVDLGSGRGVFYRVLAGPIADESTASRSCNLLKERHVACILVKP